MVKFTEIEHTCIRSEKSCFIYKSNCSNFKLKMYSITPISICSDVPVVEKEVEEVAAPKVVEADEDEKAVVENGAADESTEESESARENGDAEKEDAGNKDDEDDDTEEDEAETANGDSTGKN